MLTIAALNVHRHQSMSKMKFKYRQFCMAKKHKLATPELRVGDFVRISKTKRNFEKGYLPNWTQELFRVTGVIKSQSPVTYKIEDLDGEPIKGTFYSQELQRVDRDQIYEIESVLDRRKRKVGKSGSKN